jgi:hypothetical protein
MTHPSEDVRRAFEGDVAANADVWREVKESQEALWAALEALPPELLSTGVGTIISALKEDLDDSVRQLGERFGVGFSAKDTDGGLCWEVETPPVLRVTDDEIGLYSFLLTSALINGHIYYRVSKAMNEGRVAEGYFGELRSLDAERALAALRKEFAETPVVLAGIAQSHPALAPLAQQRGAACLSAAGWADAYIRLYGSLRAALAEEGASKHERLPSASILAWAERDPGEPLVGNGSTVNRVAKLLTSSRRSRKEIPSEEVDSTEPGFEARELARIESEDIRRRAGLSDRESEVLDLYRKGYARKEIAAHLGLGSETVKTFLERAHDKLRHAAETPSA